MHGKYTCFIKTDLGSHEMEQDLIVISQTSCKLNDWRVSSQPSQCRETFRLDCKNMFPKPVPSCGLWNSRLEKFIRSVTIDISEEPNKQTYRIKYFDKFELRPTKISQNSNNIEETGRVLKNSDLLQYAGHLMFKCDIIVPETSWKLSVMHRMFDYNDGCYQNPLETIERMRQNYSYYAAARMQQAGYLMDKPLDDFEMLTSQLDYELLAPNSSRTSKVERNCWQKPIVGSLARLSCATKASHIKLIGINLLECQPHGWVPLAEGQQQDTTARKYSTLSRRRWPPPRSSRQDTASSEGGDSLGNKDPAPEEASDVSSEASNDLEETTTIIPLTTKPASIPAANNQDGLIIFEDHQSVSTLSALQQQQLGSTILPPARLPNCISTKRRQQQSIINNGLPLLDEARILESSSSQSANPTKHSVKDHDKHKQRNSIFNFSSSGSVSSSVKHQQAIASIILVIFTTLAWFSNSRQTILTLSLHRLLQLSDNCKRRYI